MESLCRRLSLRSSGVGYVTHSLKTLQIRHNISNDEKSIANNCKKNLHQNFIKTIAPFLQFQIPDSDLNTVFIRYHMGKPIWMTLWKSSNQLLTGK